MGGISLNVVEIQKATLQKQMMTQGASQRSNREFSNLGKFAIYLLKESGGHIKPPRIFLFDEAELFQSGVHFIDGGLYLRTPDIRACNRCAVQPNRLQIALIDSVIHGFQ